MKANDEVNILYYSGQSETVQLMFNIACKSEGVTATLISGWH